MNKADKKALKNKYLAKQKADFEQHLPFDRAKFDKLFDFLDDRLQKNKCNHELRFAELFLQIHRIKNPKQVIDWLAEQGGYCDCEVLNNVSEHFDWVSKIESHEDDVPVALGIALKAKQKIACLDTDFGFKITHVPKPWTLKQGVQNPNEYFFQYGKGLGRYLPRFVVMMSGQGLWMMNFGWIKCQIQQGLNAWTWTAITSLSP